MSAHEEVLDELRVLANPVNVEGQARFGISGADRLGISVTRLRAIAREHKRDHELADALWTSGIHEARILATLVDDPTKVTVNQMERWVKDFDSWDIVDGACGNLFDKTPHAFAKAHEWSAREPEYQKRAAFSMMASLAVHAKQATDEDFEKFLPVIEREASDPRNFVKKAVSWALRQMGKRNLRLNSASIKSAERIRVQDTPAARWIAGDALRELQSGRVQAHLEMVRLGDDRRKPGSRR
jgi:3-methyladenine DNA glycosylase AlkD